MILRSCRKGNIELRRTPIFPEVDWVMTDDDASIPVKRRQLFYVESDTFA